MMILWLIYVYTQYKPSRVFVVFFVVGNVELKDAGSMMHV